MSDINVISKMQKIIVDAASSSVSVINIGPQGPAGPTGPTGATGATGAQGPMGIPDELSANAIIQTQVFS